MSSIAEQVTSAQHTGLEIFKTLVNSAFANAGELTRLNSQTAATLAERGVAHFGALAETRTLPGWLTVQRSLAVSTLGVALGYSRGVAEICGELWLTPARVLDSIAGESTQLTQQQAAAVAPAFNSAFNFFAAAARSL